MSALLGWGAVVALDSFGRTLAVDGVTDPAHPVVRVSGSDL